VRNNGKFDFFDFWSMEAIWGHYVGQNNRTWSTKVLPTRPTNSESCHS